MALKAIFILSVFFIASHARSHGNNAEVVAPTPNRGSVEAFEESESQVENAAFDLLTELIGFESNFRALREQLMALLERFKLRTLKACIPLLEAIPAEVFKDFVLNILKAISLVVDEFGAIIKEFNPLHPSKVSTKLRDFFHRTLSTVSTVGETVARLFDALDGLIVNYINVVVEGLKTGQEKFKATIHNFEHIPPDMLKTLSEEYLHGSIQAIERGLRGREGK